MGPAYFKLGASASVRKRTEVRSALAEAVPLFARILRRIIYREASSGARVWAVSSMFLAWRKRSYNRMNRSYTWFSFPLTAMKGPAGDPWNP
jgi:hypothetical protein